MTATPIPRTLAMTAYADLDTSIIDELPPGRTPVTTVALPDSRRQRGDRAGARLACEEGKPGLLGLHPDRESEVLECQAAEDLGELQTGCCPACISAWCTAGCDRSRNSG